MSWDYDSQAKCGGSGPVSHAPRASELANIRSDYIHGPRCPLDHSSRLEELLVAVASVKLAFEAAAAPTVQVVGSPAAPATSLFGAFFGGLVF
ncbi:hypothetical protein Asppvi_001224 [Aspergillus pseudoviridinutans]|uniref:Uncharacterized protein n=1 Tax=Aspergillus pseudoviridinutans TaxID=1517512 RepID=A0A9P3B6D0_9EURO|nr:uncharacterized protein Asppvi_001224 [Aspergillus pseudoviridinutans]GIJ82713.1 hypothetical protein Asppvi_001224 [Aspergillus pseudoviridinutans]